MSSWTAIHQGEYEGMNQVCDSSAQPAHRYVLLHGRVLYPQARFGS